MIRLGEFALTARMVLVVLMCLAGASTVAAQPYAWVPLAEFRDFVTPLRNVLRVVNLGTTHIQSVDLPSGIVLGQGAIDAATGHYFLITNLGTGEFETSPPRLLPNVKPWEGDALFLSPDGLHAYVCQRPATTLACALVRRSDDQILATRTGVVGVEFDQHGGHLLTVDGPAVDERTLQYFEAASPLMPVWSRSYRGLSWQLPLVAVSGGMVFTAQAIAGAPTLEALDSTTGATLISAVIAQPVFMLAAGGGRVFGVSSLSPAGSRITSYAAATLAELTHRDLGGLGFPFTVGGVNVTAEGDALIVRGHGRSTIYWAFGLMDAGTLADMPGGGFPGMGTQWAPAFTSEPLCRVSVTPESVSLPAGGGHAVFTAVPGAGCGLWPTYRGGEGFQLVGPSDREGPGPVVYEAAQNLATGYAVTHFASVAGVVRTVTVAPLTVPPDPPRVRAVRVSTGGVEISWEASTTGPIPSGFIVEGGVAGSVVSVRLRTGKTTRSLTVPAPGAGQYFVRVRAMNAVGEGAPSASVPFSIGATTPPDAPEAIVADVQGSVVRVRWTPAVTGTAAERFVVEAARPNQRPGALYFPIGTARPGETEFALVVPPALFGTYYLRVRAENAAGSSPWSGSVTVAPSACTGPPGAPAVVSALVTGSLATVDWTPATGGAEHYVIEVGSGVGASDIASFTTGGPDLRLQAQAPVSAYFVRVRGRNACGLGAPSADRVVFVLWESPY